MINLDNICQSYLQGQTSVKVLENLNFKVNKGENVYIIGPSGSGKSTLLNIIGLLESPTSGLVEIFGENCNALNLEEKVIFRKKKIGFVFQNNQLPLTDFLGQVLPLPNL